VLAVIIVTSTASVIAIRHIDTTFAELQRLQSVGDLAEDIDRRMNELRLAARDFVTDPGAGIQFKQVGEAASTLSDILKLPLKNWDFSVGDTRQPPPFQIGNATGDNTFHFYWEDSWKIKPNFTLNFGLGWNYESNALNHDLTKPKWLTPIFGASNLGPELHDYKHFSPMLGFAWSPLDSRRTVVRGSAGLFYDRVPLRALANAVLSAGNTTDLAQLRQISVSLSPTQAAAPIFPNILSGVVPSVTLFNLTTMDRNMQNAYSRQASVEIEQQLGERSTVSIGYQYVRGLDLIIQVNQNVPTCVAAGTNNGCRPNPAYANNSQYSPSASPMGGRASRRTVWRSFGATVNRRGKAWIHASADGTVESGFSIVLSLMLPLESVVG